VQVREFRTTIATSVQRDVVAELMAPAEASIGRPCLDIRMESTPDMPILLGPAEPTDEPDDE
jgi:hypothetical protein